MYLSVRFCIFMYFYVFSVFLLYFSVFVSVFFCICLIQTIIETGRTQDELVPKSRRIRPKHRDKLVPKSGKSSRNRDELVPKSGRTR